MLEKALRVRSGDTYDSSKFLKWITSQPWMAPWKYSIFLSFALLYLKTAPLCCGTETVKQILYLKDLGDFFFFFPPTLCLPPHTLPSILSQTLEYFEENMQEFELLLSSNKKHCTTDYHLHCCGDVLWKRPI